MDYLAVAKLNRNKFANLNGLYQGKILMRFLVLKTIQIFGRCWKNFVHHYFWKIS